MDKPEKINQAENPNSKKVVTITRQVKVVKPVQLPDQVKEELVNVYRNNKSAQKFLKKLLGLDVCPRCKN